VPGQALLFFGPDVRARAGRDRILEDVPADRGSEQVIHPDAIRRPGKSRHGKNQRLIIGFPLAILIVIVFLGNHWLSRRGGLRRPRRS
jgi:hypothetical protein